MAALATALPSTQMTLRQLAIHLADPQAAQHVAVKLVDEARTLTLGQLVELGSKDPQVQFPSRGCKLVLSENGKAH